MKKLLLLLLVSFGLSLASIAQTEPDAKQLYETAKEFMRKGDYDNAMLVMKKAAAKDAKNLDIQKDLCFLYYLQRDYAKAIEIGKPLSERVDADVQTFQILGMTYKAIAEYKECKKLYKKALTKYPNSGVLYNEFGELLALDKDLPAAISYWEKGIELDANYSSNYYNAVKYYAQTNNPDLFWIALYAENFVNLESYTARTAEIKKILLDTYKQLYAVNGFGEVYNKKANAFQKAVTETFYKTNNMATDAGVTAETLTAIRTRFVLDWFASNGGKYAYRLFDHMQHMLKEGIFPAYNQWLFGMVENVETYAAWVNVHQKEADAFKKFQTARIYKIPQGQYYHNTK